MTCDVIYGMSRADMMSLFPSNVCFVKTLIPKITESVGIIKSAIDTYKSNIVLCFNGGKDSTILLDLIKRVDKHVKPFYIETNDDFEEVSAFLDHSEKFWDTKILRLDTPSLKDGLQLLKDKYNTEAVFLGVRTSDLSKKVQMHFFEETTAGWPKAMRVAPILNWDYHDVWNYIEALNIPVCDLYKRGFTSIGTKSNTVPNPALWSDVINGYLHAKELKNPLEERRSRI